MNSKIRIATAPLRESHITIVQKISHLDRSKEIPLFNAIRIQPPYPIYRKNTDMNYNCIICRERMSHGSCVLSSDARIHTDQLLSSSEPNLPYECPPLYLMVTSMRTSRKHGMQIPSTFFPSKYISAAAFDVHQNTSSVGSVAFPKLAF